MDFWGLSYVIPKVFYLLTMSILSIIDFFQAVMRKLAGLDCYYIGEGEDAVAQSGDIVYDFVVRIFSNQYPILSTVFWGLVILGFILLFLSTIIAIIRSEYTTEKADNGKGKIMFKAFKSVIFFAIVPIVSIMGIYLANVVLVAVDMATTHNTNNYSVLDTSKLKTVKVASYQFGKETVRETYVTYSMFGIDGTNGDSKDILQMNKVPLGTTTTTFSGVIFKAAAHNANRVRTTMYNERPTDPKTSTNFAQLLNTNNATNFDGLFTQEDENYSKLAVKIDTAFADNVVLATTTTLDFNNSTYIKDNNLRGLDPFGYDIDGKTIYKLDKFDVQLVWYYYDLWQFNFIIGIGAAVVCATIFINIIFGLMRRIIDVVGLFMIAPPLIGLMPLDNEKAYNSWRGSFIKKVLMAYGAIGGMNIILLLLPELFSIKMFNIDLVDWIFQTLLVLVALLAVKDFINIVSNLAGGDDANSVGEKVGKDVGALAGKAVAIGATAVGGVAGVGKAAVAVGKKGFDVGKFASHAVRGNSVNKKASALNRAEHQDEDKKAAKDEEFRKYRTNLGTVNKAKTDLGTKYGVSYMANLAPEEKQRLLNEQLRENFEDEYNDATKGATMRSNAEAEFNARQATRNITNKDIARTQTKYGQRIVENEAYDKNLKELKARRKAGVGGVTRTDIRLAKKEGWKDDFSFIGKQISDVGKPIASSGINFGKEISSIYSSNSFNEGFMGKDRDTLVDAAYRLAGTNKKAAEKLKTKSKEQAAEMAKLKQQQEMLLNALRQIEAERNK